MTRVMWIVLVVLGLMAPAYAHGQTNPEPVVQRAMYFETMAECKAAYMSGNFWYYIPDPKYIKKTHPDAKGTPVALCVLETARESPIDVRKDLRGPQAYVIHQEGTPEVYNQAGICTMDGRCWNDIYEFEELPRRVGAPGDPGLDGINCWDRNKNRMNDAEEDTSGPEGRPDGIFDVFDCQGPPGKKGDPGQGLPGPAGCNAGFHRNGAGVCVPDNVESGWDWDLDLPSLTASAGFSPWSTGFMAGLTGINDAALCLVEGFDIAAGLHLPVWKYGALEPVLTFHSINDGARTQYRTRTEEVTNISKGVKSFGVRLDYLQRLAPWEKVQPVALVGGGFQYFTGQVLQYRRALHSNVAHPERAPAFHLLGRNPDWDFKIGGGFLFRVKGAKVGPMFGIGYPMEKEIRVHVVFGGDNE